MKETIVYAPPLVWGPWTSVHGAIGRITFRITVEPTGNVPTQITGQVKYFTDVGEQIDDFVSPVFITNGNSVNSIDVRLKGVPTGSQCIVTVSPQ